MNDGFPLLECTSSKTDVIAEALATAYLNPLACSSADLKKRRKDVRAKKRIKQATPVVLKALDGTNYSAWPTPGEVLEAERKVYAECRGAFGPIQMWLLSTVLQWLIPVLVRWWFSTRSQDRRIFAARATR